MSYLDVPRLHFSGKFRADVCTVNNIPTNYGSQKIDYNDPRVGGFNPYGTGNWTIEDCTVQSVLYKDGSTSSSGEGEPLIGKVVKSMSPGKLVDLDPEQMMVSEIWGLRIQIGDTESGDYLYGHFQVAPFMDIWGRAAGAGTGKDFAQSAFYQSILTDITWGPTLSSRFLQELRDQSPDAISIKFTVDGYAMRQDDPLFTYGRLVGTIGPVSAKDEPVHFVADRLLSPVNQSITKLNYAPLHVDTDNNKVVLDLGNSIPTDTPGGDPSVANGSLSLALLEETVIPFGPIDTTANAYTARAFVQTFDLVEIAKQNKIDLEELNKKVATTPLGVIDSDNVLLLGESDDGVLLRADKFVYRLNPPEEGDYPESAAQRTVDLHVCRFGRPIEKGQISLFDASDQLQGGYGRQEGVGTPSSALQYPSTVDVIEGKASFVLTPADPGAPRQPIDGQIYGVGYRLEADNGTATQGTGDIYNFVSVIVHTLTTWDHAGPPTWWEHIQPIFDQYARLYPIMREKGFIDLGSYERVTGDHNGILQVMFTENIENPAYMPVSRDLSYSKHKLIMAWFDAGMPEGAQKSN